MLWQRLRIQLPLARRAVKPQPQPAVNADNFAPLPAFAQHATCGLQSLYAFALEQARRQIAERRQKAAAAKAEAHRWN
jgi:hypothetical protein